MDTLFQRPLGPISIILNFPPKNHLVQKIQACRILKRAVQKVIHENQVISKLHLQAFLPAKRAATHRLTALVREKTREKPEISTPTLLRPTMARITKFYPKKEGFFVF